MCSASNRIDSLYISYCYQVSIRCFDQIFGNLIQHIALAKRSIDKRKCFYKIGFWVNFDFQSDHFPTPYSILKMKKISNFKRKSLLECVVFSLLLLSSRYPLYNLLHFFVHIVFIHKIMILIRNIDYSCNSLNAKELQMRQSIFSTFNFGCANVYVAF